MVILVVELPYGVQTNGENSKIEFGDGAGIEMTGNAAVGVETSADNSHIKFGESAEIVLQGDYNYGASVWSENSSIEFGADAKITAVSNAVRVGGNDSQAIFGADAILTTSGDNAYTVHLGAASGSSITYDNFLCFSDFFFPLFPLSFSFFFFSCSFFFFSFSRS